MHSMASKKRLEHLVALSWTELGADQGEADELQMAADLEALAAGAQCAATFQGLYRIAT